MRIAIISALALTIILVTGCSPSESAIQTAIAETEIAKPTATNTVIPSDTPTVTPSLTPTETPTVTPSQTPSVTPTTTPTATPTPLPLDVYLLGKWKGAYNNKEGDQIFATWTFFEGGIMVTDVTFFAATLGSKWWVEGDMLHFSPDSNPDEPTFRHVEIISHDVMRTWKHETDVVETWSRIIEE